MAKIEQNCRTGFYNFYFRRACIFRLEQKCQVKYAYNK